MRVLADRTEVDTLTTALEKQEAIKGLEDQGVRLVDGAKNRNTGTGKLLQETGDTERAGRIKTGSGFIEEEKQVGLGSELDTDSDELAVRDRETVAGCTKSAVSKILRENVRKPIMPSARSWSSRSSMMSST